MRGKFTSILKTAAHIILFIVSTILTITLFVQFSNHYYEKILWGAVGLALEFIKLYLFMLAKKHFKEGNKKANFIASFELIVYFGLAFVSMIASLGFVLMTIQQQSLEAVDTNLGREAIIENIKVIDQEIANIIQQQKNLPPQYVTSAIRLSTRLQELKTDKEKLTIALNNFGKERIVTSKDVFTLLGEQVGKTGQQMLFVIMIIMIFTLEICLVLTSGDLKGEIKLSAKSEREKKEIFDYIDALIDETSGKKKLITDKKVSEITGISLQQCKTYREFLANTFYKSIPTITIRKGGTKANYKKSDIKKLVGFKINTINPEEN